MQVFFKTLATERVGMLDKKLILGTLCSYAIQLGIATYRELDVKLLETEITEVKNVSCGN